MPQAADPLCARARVRHHDKLRYGMEFVGLTAQQQETIRQWTEEAKAPPEPGGRAKLPMEAGKGSESGGSSRVSSAGSTGRSGGPPPPAGKPRSRGWIFLLVSTAILLAVLWWRWNRGWEDIESGLRKNETAVQVRAHVPADVMQKLVAHRVDPDYPAAARPGKLRGVIVLDVVVGRDGSVVDVHALNGPEVLAQSAMDALRWWRFEPYRVDGEPVVAETTVAVEFKP